MVRALRFRNAAEWRRWLEAHHASSSEAHLVLSKKSVTHGLHYPDALEEALCFGWIDGKLHARDASTFLLRFTPRRADGIWSEANRERAERLIRDGRMAPPGLAAIDRAKASGAWTRARRPSRKPPMPRDLGSALRGNARAWSNFRAWGDSFQSGYIYWVTDAKGPETRERRIRQVVERAAKDLRPGVDEG